MSSNALDLESSANPQQILETDQIEQKIRRSTKPLPLKMEVIQRYTIGQSKAKIAKALQINANTVHAILKECDFARVMPEGAKYGMNTLAFDSVEAIAHHVGKKNLKAAMYVLDKTVFVEEASGKTFQQNLQVNVHIPRPDSKQFEQPQIAANSEVIEALPASTTTNSVQPAKSKA